MHLGPKYAVAQLRSSQLNAGSLTDQVVYDYVVL